MDKNIFNIIKFVLGISIIISLFYFIGFKEICFALALFKLEYLPPIIILFLLFILMNAYNIKIMIDPFKKIKFENLLKYYCLGWTSSLFLPAKIGEFSISVFLKDKIEIGKTGAAIFMDKLITFVISAVIAVIGLASFFNGEVILKTITVLVLCIAVLAVMMSNKGRLFIRRFILRKYAKNLTGFSKTFFSYFRSNRRPFLINILITLIKAVLTALFGYFIFLSLGTFVNPLVILAVGAVETISILFPFTLNGLGVKQGIGIYIFHLAGINPSIVAARYIIGLIVRYLFGLFVILFIRLK